MVRIDGDRTRYRHEVDAANGTLTLRPTAAAEVAPPPPIVLRYSSPDPAHLDLDGAIDGATLRLRCRRLEPSDFPLIQRGFHWIHDPTADGR